ncbi:MAG: hypothetical protein HW384_1090 [Dehalococcoidia bacterium]|nr:hypothetical protein [Dehalococcoidia bacterium]MBF8304192.1 hypothetical protein [Dehalococcoidia bacterium]
MGDEKIKISGVKGDVVFGSGSGNIVGKNVKITGNVTLSNQQLSKIPTEYAKSLESFTQTINQELEKRKVPAEKAAPVQEAVKELAKEMEDVRSDQVTTIKTKHLNTKVSALIDAVVKILPKTAETLTAFTPLAPFSKLIGEGVEQLAKALQKEA